jgi:hypothetical protein
VYLDGVGGLLEVIDVAERDVVLDTILLLLLGGYGGMGVRSVSNVEGVGLIGTSNIEKVVLIDNMYLCLSDAVTYGVAGALGPLLLDPPHCCHQLLLYVPI